MADARSAKGGVPGLSMSLSRLYLGWLKAPDEAAEQAARQGVEIRGGQVKAMLIMFDESSATAAAVAIGELGGAVTAQFRSWLDAWVPVSALAKVGGLPSVSLVRLPVKVVPLEDGRVSSGATELIGSALTQGVAASNASAWHAAGHTGSGVKVAVLDSFKDYTLAQAQGDLPASVTTYGTLDVSSRHGTAVAEVIYDMAPGALLTFASPGSATEMAAFIVALAQAGNKIISSSMGFYNAEPGDGTGVVADAVTTAYTTYGVLYVQAAGNQALYHWDGVFVDSDGDGYHEFASGTGGPDEVNLLGTLPAGEAINLYLRWNNWPATNQDYDLYLLYWNGTLWETVECSCEFQNGSQPPAEGIETVTTAPGEYGVAIKRYSATGTQVLDMMGHNAPSFEHNVSDRSLVDPATSRHAFSVAAVDVDSPHNLESYSSWGPTHGPGGTLTGGLDKPRIAAFANVDTWAYGAGAFNGTSAATPHVAGAAALVLSANPTYTATQVASFLESRAVDQGTMGYDYKYGAGRLLLGAPPTYADAYEPDDTTADAKWISADGTRQTRNFYVAGDVDWVKVNLVAGTQYIIQTSNLGANSDTYLCLYDVNGSTLVACDDNGAGGLASRLAWISYMSSTYYLKVHHVSSSASGQTTNYDLSVAPAVSGEGFGQPSIWLSDFGIAQGWESQNTYPRAVGDVNGDGRVDIVGFGNDGVYVSLSTGIGFAPATRWLQDFGKTAGGWTSQDVYPRMVADVNADGRADIIGFASDGAYVSLSTGSSFGAKSRWSAHFGRNQSSGGWVSQNVYPRAVADVNGDGMADVVGFANAGVEVALSTGASFGPASTWIRHYGVGAGSWWTQTLYPRLVEDANADGKADIIGFAWSGIYVSPSTGHAFVSGSRWIAYYTAGAGGWTSQNYYPRAAGDVDGDGMADVLGFASVGVYGSLSTGSSYANAALWIGAFGKEAGDWLSQSLYPRMLGDVNGDGRADIIGFGQSGVHVSLAGDFTGLSAYATPAPAVEAIEVHSLEEEAELMRRTPAYLRDDLAQ
jgi:subtilisin family serine protease